MKQLKETKNKEKKEDKRKDVARLRRLPVQLWLKIVQCYQEDNSHNHKTELV